MKNKSEALSSITHRVRNGQDVFEVYVGTDVTGKQIRLSRNTAKELREALDDFYKRYRMAGPVAMELSARQILDARLAIDELRMAGYDVSLLDAAKEYIRRMPPSSVSISLGDAYTAYLDSFNTTTQKLQVRTVRSRVGRWVQAVGAKTPLAKVERPLLEDYLNKHYASSAKTWNNVLTYCQSFMRWCCSPTIGLKESPFAAIRRKTIAYEEPEFVTVDAMERVAQAVEEAGDKGAMAYIALSFFSGIRFEEILRLKESVERDLNLADEAVRISKPKGWTKGVRPRVVQLQGNARAWLAAAGGAATVARTDMMDARLRVSRTAAALGEAWPHNAGRHSFITYHVAKFGEPAKRRLPTSRSARR